MPKLYASCLRAAALALLPLAAGAQVNTSSPALLEAQTTDATPITRLRLQTSGGLYLGGSYDGGAFSGGVPAEGSGTRLMWYPQKAAFRAGYITGTQWDDANIGYFSTAGGYNARASGAYATAFGKDVVAAQINSTAMGEFCFATGAASVALGYYASTNSRQGSFVFADRTVLDDGNVFTDEAFRADYNHSAAWRVTNGFRIYTSADKSTGVIIQSGATLSGSGSNPNWYQPGSVICTHTGAYLSGGGAWTNASDRHKKHRFEAVSGEDVLARLRRVPVTRWSYKADPATTRHLGPMAQDFRRAFQLGSDSVSIATVDADGVALAGVQALDARTRALQAENARLRARLDALERVATAPGTASMPLNTSLLAVGIGLLGLLLLRRQPHQA